MIKPAPRATAAASASSLLFFIFLLLLSPLATHASYRRTCSLSGQNLATLAFDPGENVWLILDDGKSKNKELQRTQNLRSLVDGGGGDVSPSSEFTELERDSDDAMTRTLSSVEIAGGAAAHGAVSPTFPNSEQNRRILEGDLPTFQARRCPCTWNYDLLPPFYCLSGTGELCGVKRNADVKFFSGEEIQVVGCLSDNDRVHFVRNIWPVVILAYGAFFVALFATRSGRGAMKYVLGWCFPGINDNMEDRIYHREMVWLDRVRREAMLAARRRMGGEERPTEYILKTRTFGEEEETTGYEDGLDNDKVEKGDGDDGNLSATIVPLPDNSQAASVDPVANPAVDSLQHQRANELFGEDGGEDDPDDDDGVTCTICLLRLQPGDRIGALPCRHCFHVECLKPWIQRRNACPLCQEPDIAQPRRRDGDDEEEVWETQDGANDETQRGGRVRNALNRIGARVFRRPNAADDDGLPSRAASDRRRALNYSVTPEEAVIHRRIRRVDRSTRRDSGTALNGGGDSGGRWGTRLVAATAALADWRLTRGGGRSRGVGGGASDS